MQYAHRDVAAELQFRMQHEDGTHLNVGYTTDTRRLAHLLNIFNSVVVVVYGDDRGK